MAQTPASNAAQPPAAPTASPPTISNPPNFIAADMYPNIRTGYNQASIPIINSLVSLLNTSVHYASEGKVNFPVFKSENFNFDESESPSVDQKNLMSLSKLVFHTLLNSGNTYPQPLTGQQIEGIVNKVQAAGPLQNLSQTRPTGQLATKIPGNLKTSIIDLLMRLKVANPPRR